MGNGVCSRRQRRIFQCLLLVTVVCGMMYWGMISYEMHKQLRRAETMALKYQQHQESLSAQLQVVYEHRSRLEKSLQKERLEHKKAKEDYLVYKLEAQQSLNKEKQEASSRLNSLQVQHQMLKNQHDDLKKQYYDLHEQHQAQGEDHGRLLNEHKDRYDKLQQAKELEVSQLKENVYNLREENRQLRKAHHDIHVQLQDARVQHQDLKAAHDQLVLTVEDHKSALAAAQVQVEAYKELKESLNKIPSMREAKQNPVPQQQQAARAFESHVHEAQNIQIVSSTTLAYKKEPPQEHHQHTESRFDHQDVHSHSKSHPTVSHGLLEKEDQEGEAERRRELAEEEMAQAGQPQKLEEDPDQPQDEQLEEEGPEQEGPDENALDRQRRHPQPDVDLYQNARVQQEAHARVEQVKSPYEQQKEQQRLEAQRAEERRQIQMRQDALQAERERILKERESRLKEEKEREEQQHMEADRREQILHEEQQRKRTAYENTDTDTIPGGDHRTDDEEEADMLHEAEEKQVVDHRVPSHQQAALDGELDPEDDPNNQGEDEFEEAEDERTQHRVTEPEDEGVEEEEEHAAPAQHIAAHPGPKHPVVEEELVIAGNPDQQEDAVDDQYQEEVEDEAQEDVADGHKRAEEVEEEGEDPYNEGNIEEDEVKHQQEPRKEGDHRKDRGNNEEDNYEDEGGEDTAGQNKGTNRRAEM